MPSIGQTWVLASIGAVVEMGVLTRTLERLLMESTFSHGPTLISLNISVQVNVEVITSENHASLCLEDLQNLGQSNWQTAPHAETVTVTLTQNPSDGK
jgi:hypothetical protein